MAYEGIREKKVVCRKDHFCEWCGQGIAKGDEAHYRVYVYDGDFNSGHMHPECWSAMMNSDHHDLEWTPGGPARGEPIV